MDDLAKDAPFGASPANAEQWFARMRGSPDAAERAAFERWCALPVNQEAYDHLVRVWDQSMFVASLDVGRNRNLGRAAKGAGWNRSALAAGLAAVFVLGSVVAIGWPRLRAPSSGPMTPVEFVAGPQEIRPLALVDGSRLVLDRNSAVAMRFDPSRRWLRLERGRARFDVAPEPNRPFVVEAGDSSLTAVGTVFDVAIEDRSIRVALIRGAVEVRERGASGALSRPRRLSAGQQLQLGKDADGVPIALARADLQWTQDMIGFEGEPLFDAVAAFNRTSRHPVRLGPRVPRAVRLSGTFRRDDPAGFAQAVAATFGLTVQSESDGSIVILSSSAADAKKP